MTEKAGGSDVGAIETDGAPARTACGGCTATNGSARTPTPMSRCCWRGRKARPPAPRGLALFALPRRLKDGRRNGYRIVRLKDKLGTRSMAIGRDPARRRGGLSGRRRRPRPQADDGAGQSVAAVARRARRRDDAPLRQRGDGCARAAARRSARPSSTIPLLRRQLMKIMVPTEQALSMFLFAADAMGRANAGSKEAESMLRILTPLLKFRACRDNIPVATGAMEVRGGNGYIEEWVNARLVRDAQIGVLWEGTSNINALDVITRAVGKSRAHRTLRGGAARIAGRSHADPGGFPRPPAAGARSRAGLRRARRRRTRAGSERAAGGQRALSHHQRHPDDVGSGPAGRRRAPGAVCAVCPRTSPERAEIRWSPPAGEWEREAAEIMFSERSVAITDIAGLLV